MDWFCSLYVPFLSSSDAILKPHDFVQQKYLMYFLKSYQPKRDPDKVIFNYLKDSLSDTEKWLLVKELCFSLPPKNINYADY